MLTVLLFAAALSSAPSAQDSLRMVIESGATCHSQPDPGSPIAETYRLGDLVGASKSQPGQGRRIWYFDSWRVKGIAPTCWIPANVTTPFDRANPEPAFVAAAEHVLARKDAKFADYVGVENLLEEPFANSGLGPSPLPRSPHLQALSLLLIARAADHLSLYTALGDPLEHAWVIAHAKVLAFFEPGADWYVPTQNYWKILDANVTAPWADDIAWQAAQQLMPADECGADCHLMRMAEGPQKYWTRYPRGQSIAKALELGAAVVRDAITSVGEGPPTHKQINDARASLSAVTAPEKAKLLELLIQLERSAKR